MEISNPFDIIFLIFELLFKVWWIILPPILFSLFIKLWTGYLKMGYISKISWTILEIKMPKEVLQTPKSMENVFTSLHSMSGPANEFLDKYWKGKIQDYMSLEIVGDGGRSHFYIRMPSALKGYFSSQIYSQYPKAELKEVPDYVSDIPINIPDPQHDLWGTEMMLTKEDAYPIRTYLAFEETIEEKRIDPLASLLESFTQLRDGEKICIQILAKPHSSGWEKAGKELINKLIGKKTAVKKTWADDFFDFLFSIINGIVGEFIGGGSAKAPEKKDATPTQMQHLTPGQKEVVESVEKNIAKLGFDIAIRVLYIGRRDVYNRANIVAINGFFKQFNTLNLNGFKPNKEVTPKVKYYLKTQREFFRKRKVYMSYRMRMPGKASFVFNTEELATIFHFPSTVVESPTAPRIESKKSEPPFNLPI